MNAQPKWSKDEFLRLLVIEELDPESEQARALFVEHPEWEVEYAELLETELALGDYVVEAKQAAAQPSQDQNDAPLLQSFHDIAKGLSHLASQEKAAPQPNQSQLRSVASNQATSSGPRPIDAQLAQSSWLKWLAPAAAAALLITVFQIGNKMPSGPSNTGSSGGGGESITLGNSDTCVHPLNEVSEYGRFEWTMDQPMGGTFELTLYAITPDGQERYLHSEPDLFDPFWDYDPTLPNLSPTPAHLRWEILSFDASGQPTGNTASAEAWLRE